VQTLWVQTIRAPILPLRGSVATRAAGKAVFVANCASCHGGAKWTMSEVIYANNPTLTAPLPAGIPRDANLTVVAGQIDTYKDRSGARPIQTISSISS
jgi:mono/diheme cytochrome c family protein